jgi:hypothetical protein
MARRSIVAVYSDSDWHQAQTAQSPLMKQRYGIWGEVCRGKKVDLLRASVTWFHNGHFKQYWRYAGEGTWEKVRRPVQPTAGFDVLEQFDKKTGDLLPEYYPNASKVAKYVPLVNIPEFTMLVGNKLNQAAIFYKHAPRARMWRPGETLLNPKGKVVVLKKIAGSGGQFVMITRQKKIKIDEVRVQQEFISAGKNGVLHDVRICFVGDEPQYAYKRIASAGNLYTNIRQGATMEWLNFSQIRGLIKHAKEVAKPLHVFPKRHFSLDFLIEARTGKPYLVEATNFPGTANFSDALMERYMSNLTTHILEGL